MKFDLAATDYREIFLIIAVYVTFSSLWIYFSDYMLAAIIADPDVRTRVSVYKGFAFIVLSSALVLYPLMVRYARRNRKAEEMTRYESERLQLALDSAHMGMFDMNTATGELVWDDRSVALLGIPPGSEHSVDVAFQSILSEDEAAVRQAIEQALDPGSNGKLDQEFRVLWPDGTIHWVACKGQAYYEGEGAGRRACRLMGINIDVTAPKETEERLRHSEERFRLVADSMPNLVWTASPDGTIGYVNKVFREYTGLENIRDEAVFVHPEDWSATEKIWLNAIRTGTPYEIEHRFRRHDGMYRWFLCRAIPVRDSRGRIIQWYGTSTDIHELKAAHERLSRILDSTSDGFIAMDRDWHVTYFNTKAEELSGIKADRVLGRTYWEAFPQAVGTRMEHEYRLALEENRSLRFEEYLDRYGRLLDVYVHPYSDGLCVFFHDLSDRERAADALRSKTAELESLLSHAPIGFAFFDRSHRYVRVNRALVEINGVPEEETVGKTIGEVLPGLAVHVDPILDQVLKTGEAVESEISGKTPREPAVTRNWLAGFYPIFDSTSEPLAVGAYVVDITERKRAEEAMARLAAIVEGADDAIFSEDLLGSIQTWNRGAERLYGYRADEVIGKHVSLLVPRQYLGELEEMTRKMHAGVEDHFETVRITKSGTRINVFLTMSPIKDSRGRIVGASKIVHDISSRKRDEERLKETVRALERSNRELQQFAYVASHDLQEPLRNVSRYVELFALKYRGLVDETGAQYIRFAVEGATRIHSMLNDLLAFSEVGSRAKEFQIVPMGMVAEEVMANLRPALEESEAAVTMDSLPDVYGDRTQLVQLLQNLLSNAIKFRSKGVPPQVRISAQRVADEWRFGIHDNGIGIEPEYVQKIFIIFQRLHSRSEFPGTGIGLAICRKIVEWHGGRIWVESTYGEGAVFYFTIPIRGGAP